MPVRLATACVGLLFGCSAGAPTRDMPVALPDAWVQQPAERDLLPVGRVIRVEVLPNPFPRPPESPGEYTGVPGASTPSLGDAVMMASYPILWSATVIAFLPVATVAWMSGAPAPAASSQQVENGVFRHTVRLKDTLEEVVRDEYWRFAVGDCAAIRAKPVMLVPALPGICD